MKYKIGREILYISETLLVVIIGLFLFTSPSKTYNIFKVYLPTEITYMVIFLLISMVFVLNIRNMQMQQCKRLHRVAPLRKIKIFILKSPIHNHFQETKR